MSHNATNDSTASRRPAKPAFASPDFRFSCTYFRFSIGIAESSGQQHAAAYRSRLRTRGSRYGPSPGLSHGDDRSGLLLQRRGVELSGRAAARLGLARLQATPLAVSGSRSTPSAGPSCCRSICRTRACPQNRRGCPPHAVSCPAGNRAAPSAGGPRGTATWYGPRRSAHKKGPPHCEGPLLSLRQVSSGGASCLLSLPLSWALPWPFSSAPSWLPFLRLS